VRRFKMKDDEVNVWQYEAKFPILDRLIMPMGSDALVRGQKAIAVQSMIDKIPDIDPDSIVCIGTESDVDPVYGHAVVRIRFKYKCKVEIPKEGLSPSDLVPIALVTRDGISNLLRHYNHKKVELRESLSPFIADYEKGLYAGQMNTLNLVIADLENLMNGGGVK
jgi:hypothetical protein